MTLRDRIEQNKLQQQKAREDGNPFMLVGLMALGGLLMVGHAAVVTQSSLRSVLKGLCKKSGKALAKDETQHVMEAAGNALDDKKRERDGR